MAAPQKLIETYHAIKALKAEAESDAELFAKPKKGSWEMDNRERYEYCQGKIAACDEIAEKIEELVLNQELLR